MMLYFLAVYMIFLFGLKTGDALPVDRDCGWSVDDSGCPVYGSFSWQCLGDKLNCQGTRTYHCAKDETGIFRETCAELQICMIGQEPIITKDGDISCKYCQDPERYNPVENTPSNEISECPRKKSKCVKGITCQNTEPKYMQNRLCRCDNTNNFLPLNYNFDEDSFVCVEEDELECVQVPCPVTVHGSKQIRGQDYRCYPEDAFDTLNKISTDSMDAYTVLTTTKIPARQSDDEDKAGPPTVVIVLIILIIVAVLITLLVLLGYKWMKRKGLGPTKILFINIPLQPLIPVPGGPIVASDIKYRDLILSWQHPEEVGNSKLTHYIIEKRESKGADDEWTSVERVAPEETKCHVAGLQEATLYFFRVSAQNKRGTGQPIETDGPVLTKSITVPDEPAGPIQYTDITTDSVTVSWNPPDDDGGLPVHEYTIDMYDNLKKSWKEVASVNKSTTSWTYNGLLQGHIYKFRISANNEKGRGEALETSEFVKPKPPSPPDIPNGPLKVSEIGYTDLMLSWQPPEHDGGSPLTGFIIEKRERKLAWQIGKTDSKTTQFHVTKLIPGTQYLFCVVAKNDVGYSKPLATEVVATRTQTVPGEPNGPIKFTNLTDSSLTLSWKQPTDDGGFPVKAYSVECYDSQWNFIESKHISNKETVSVAWKNLVKGNEYWFKVFAINDKGKGEPLKSEDKVIPKYPKVLPSAPESLKIKDTDEDSLTLTWKPPKKDGGAKVKFYHIYMKEDGGRLVEIAKVDDDILTYQVTSLKLDKKYVFEILAENDVGCGVAVASKPKKSGNFFSRSSSKKKEKSLSVAPAAGENGEERISLLQSDDRLTDESQTDPPLPSPANSVEPDEMPRSQLALISRPPDKNKPLPPLGPMKYNNITHNAVELSWQPPASDRGAEITKYTIEYREVNHQDWTEAGTADGALTKFTVTGLEDSTGYKFRVTACNAAGFGSPLESREKLITKEKNTVPYSPRNINALKLIDNKVTLTWIPPTEDGGSEVTKYHVFSKDNDSIWKQMASVPSSQTRYETGELTAGSYYFAVSAESSEGCSDQDETSAPTVVENAAGYAEGEDRVDHDEDGQDDEIPFDENWDKEEKCKIYLQMLDKSETWKDLTQHVSALEAFLEECLKIPAETTSEITGLDIYPDGDEFLSPLLEAYESSTDENCLFSSVSAVLYGNEGFTHRLRLATVYEGIINSESYSKKYFKDKSKDSITAFMKSTLTQKSLQQLDESQKENVEYLAKFAVRMIVRETAKPESSCNTLQVEILCNAIKFPILQHFQKGTLSFYGKVNKEYELVKPEGLEKVGDSVRILWVNEPRIGGEANKTINYVVPVIKKPKKPKDKKEKEKKAKK